MNFLKFNKYLKSDNDGTFWPGYIEIPDDEGLASEFDTDNEDKGNRFISNPRVFTGLGLLLVVSLLFLNKTSAFILLILVALISTKEWFDIFDYGVIIPYPLLLYASLAPLVIAYFYGCLLYTSPSPRDLKLSRMPSSA